MAVKVPQSGSPLVRELFRAFNDKGLNFEQTCERAGIDPGTVRRWRKRPPKLDGFEAVLNVMGLELMILPKVTNG